MSKNILYISYDGMTDPLGQSQVLPYLEGLSQSGYRFTLLSFEKKELFQQFGTLIRAKCEKAGIEWVPLFFHSKPPVIAKIFDRYKLFSTAKKLHRERKFGLVHCRSYIAAELGLKFKKRYGVKFLFDMRGFWADEKAEGGLWNQQKWFYRKIYRHYKEKEREFVEQADHIISLTQAGKNELAKLYDKILRNIEEAIETKCTVIPCCADLGHFNYERFSEADKNVLRKKLNIDSRAVILSYSGSLGTWYMLDEMLLFFKAFKAKYPNAVFLFLTKDVSRLNEAIKKNDIDPANIVTSFSSYEQLPLYLSLSDYSVFFIRPVYSKIASSPTKHAELMGMGVPVFCNDIGDTGFFLHQYPLGQLVSIAEKEFYSAIDKMYVQDSDRGVIRNVAKKHFDLSVGIERYRKVYGLADL
ncbi:MAG: glycosyltransferase [Chitinophagaceae bacterium]|nr:glycosyltransferase [Chitinophagaceae bacterium]